MMNTTSAGSSSSSSQRQYSPEERRALQEAQHVLESLESPDILDGFNLLGVVANPRGPPHHERSASRSSGGLSGRSLHGRSQHGRSSTAGETAAASTSDSSFYFADSTMQVIHSMTEQIDVLNDTLDYWSRQYLGTSYEDEILEYTPPELSEMTCHENETAVPTDLSFIQRYLEESGTMAQKLSASLEQQSQQDNESLEDQQTVEETIAPLFFQDYFDLTDPSTFCQLLVREDGDDEDGEAIITEQVEEAVGGGATSDSASTTDPSHHAALHVPTSQILRLPPPDFFTPSLDRVEVSLLNQVRCKSTQFFHETNRFGLLQEWISSLVQECKRVRTILENLKHNSVQAWELIPQLDTKRHDVVQILKVLDLTLDVIRCKASIGGLLSAGQDLHAAEQIQYGRELLQSEEIHGLTALSTVEQQLSQYEALVVANLGNELIEVFLDFNTQHKTRVPELVRGLELCNALSSTAVLYGNRLNDVIRMTVRTTVGEFAEENAANASTTVKAGVTSMTLERFLDCLDMLFEQLMTLLKASVGVKEFCAQEGIMLEHEKGDLTVQAVASAAELSSKSISELLRLRKDAHSLVTLEEMKRLWDVCMSFTTQFETLTDYKATGLRSTLLAQAKAFVERKHESNMSSLVAALESERWTQCDVSAERQDALTRLCLGRSVMYTSTRRLVVDDETKPAGELSGGAKKKMADAEVEGVRYKVVWSCLLLVEMVMTDMACAAHFKALATNMVGKVAELLRLFNSRSTQLVLGAGAIHSAARLKSINAKHLSLVTQCVGLIISILPHVRAALMAQLPVKQHTLLNDLDTIKREYEEHNEKVLNKFVNIIGGIVEHGLAPRIGNTSFDDRAKDQLPEVPIACCVFLEGISTNTRKMHQVLSSLLPPDHLQDSFSRIFAYLDQKIPELFLAAAVGNPPSKPPTFSLPSTDDGKKQMLLEVQTTTRNLNELAGVRPWDFSAVSVLEQELGYKLPKIVPSSESNGQSAEKRVEDEAKDESGQSQMPAADEAVPLPETNGPSVEKPVEDDAQDESGQSPMPVEGDAVPDNTENDSTPSAAESKPLAPGGEVNGETRPNQSPETGDEENDAATEAYGPSGTLPVVEDRGADVDQDANDTAELENGGADHHADNGTSNKPPATLNESPAPLEASPVSESLEKSMANGGVS